MRIDFLRDENAKLRSVLYDLLQQVESLQGYELTRDIEDYKAEANWLDAINEARKVLQTTVTV